MFKELTKVDDPFDKARWYMDVVLPYEITFCNAQKITTYIKNICKNQSRLRAKRACDIAFRMANEPDRFVGYNYVSRM